MRCSPSRPTTATSCSTICRMRSGRGPPPATSSTSARPRTTPMCGSASAARPGPRREPLPRIEGRKAGGPTRLRHAGLWTAKLTRWTASDPEAGLPRVNPLASAGTPSDGRSEVAVRRFRYLPFEPTHDARVVAGGNVESHPGRSFEMRSKDGARPKHVAFALSGFRERERVRDVWQPRPNEHSVGRLCKHFESDSLESPHDVDPRLPETLP